MHHLMLSSLSACTKHLLHCVFTCRLSLTHFGSSLPLLQGPVMYACYHCRLGTSWYVRAVVLYPSSHCEEVIALHQQA